MTLPGFRVRISFDAPGDGIGSAWYDVSDYVRYIRTTFGRSQELDQIEAATARVVLVNTDGRFTPGNTTSPYTGIRPYNQLEVEWTSDANLDPFTLGSAVLGGPDATLYDSAPPSAKMFRGLITTFSPEFRDSADGGYSEMTLDAVDFLAWIQKQDIPGTSFSQQTVGARISAVLTAIGNPFPSEIDTGGPTLIAETRTDNALTYIKDIVDLDGGAFYCRGGTLVYIARSTLQASTNYLESQITLGDQVGDYRGTALRMTLEESLVINKVNGAIWNGTPITEQTHAASQSYYLTRERDFGTTSLLNSADLDNRAKLELDTYAEARWRVDGVDFNLLDPNLDSSALIDLDLFDRVTVERTPPGGDLISIETHFQGVEHEVYPGTWKMTISVSSVPYGWMLGSSRLGETTVLG